MFIYAWFLGSIFRVYQCPNESAESDKFKRGKLGLGQVWAQLDADSPYRPMRPATPEEVVEFYRA